MLDWAERLLHAMDPGREELEVFDRIASSAQELGFERCAFGLRVPLPATAPRTVMLNNYAPEWQLRYREAGYLELDPTVLHGRQSERPLLWSAAVFSETPQLWSEAISFGLRHGWCQARHDAFGVRSMLTLARASEPISRSEFAAKELPLQWLVNVSHLALGQFAKGRVYGEDVGVLTARETEVLQWTVDGKTCSEIADILSISVDTVNFHVKNVAVKLNTPNKISTATRALAMGLLR